jgi:hypothetical protein
MKNPLPIILLCAAFISTTPPASAGQPETTIEFTISMDQQNAHCFHVELRCSVLEGETQDLKLPSWTPGFYRTMDYARNILSFRAADEAGNPLSWEKTAKNARRVKSGQSSMITVGYDAYAFNLAPRTRSSGTRAKARRDAPCRRFLTSMRQPSGMSTMRSTSPWPGLTST